MYSLTRLFECNTFYVAIGFIPPALHINPMHIYKMQFSKVFISTVNRITVYCFVVLVWFGLVILLYQCTQANKQTNSRVKGDGFGRTSWGTTRFCMEKETFQNEKYFIMDNKIIVRGWV